LDKDDAKIYYSDARNLSKVLPSNSVDYVFTSPPYFDCLDYTAYYAKIIYEIFQADRELIRDSLIQKFNTYEHAMREVLNDLYIVCKPGSKIIFVVGDKKIHGEVINGAEFFNKITPFKLVEVVERSYTNSTSQVFDEINKTARKEQIVVWQK
jgi:DNA modification methylase